MTRPNVLTKKFLCRLVLHSRSSSIALYESEDFNRRSRHSHHCISLLYVCLYVHRDHAPWSDCVFDRNRTPFAVQSLLPASSLSSLAGALCARAHINSRCFEKFWRLSKYAEDIRRNCGRWLRRIQSTDWSSQVGRLCVLNHFDAGALQRLVVARCNDRPCRRFECVFAFNLLLVRWPMENVAR